MSISHTISVPEWAKDAAELLQEIKDGLVVDSPRSWSRIRSVIYALNYNLQSDELQNDIVTFTCTYYISELTAIIIGNMVEKEENK